MLIYFKHFKFFFKFICLDINECLPQYDSLRYNESKCVANAECVDTIGDYTCKCAVGFEGDGTVVCNGIDLSLKYVAQDSCC